MPDSACTRDHWPSYGDRGILPSWSRMWPACPSLHLPSSSAMNTPCLVLPSVPRIVNDNGKREMRCTEDSHREGGTLSPDPAQPASPCPMKLCWGKNLPSSSLLQKPLRADYGDWARGLPSLFKLSISGEKADRISLRIPSIPLFITVSGNHLQSGVNLCLGKSQTKDWKASLFSWSNIKTAQSVVFS